MSQVSIRNVCKSYGGEELAVNDASLGVGRGEFLVIVGPSGCGKSTLLRMVAGLEEVGSGQIWIGDRLVNHVPPKERNIAMVFQNYALYPHMTVYDNMAFGLRLRNIPKSEIETRVQDAAQILGLGHYLHRKPRELSGGERQRVAVGRAIVRKPLVFLFDEPLSNLDAKLRTTMRTEINKLHQRLQATMIYVTHDQTEAMTMGDRIAVMKDGEIQQIADPMMIYEHPANRFVAGFIGSPPMNFIQGRIIKLQHAYYFDEGKFRLRLLDDLSEKIRPYEGKEVTFGVRPEDIYDKLFVTDAPKENTFTATVEVVEPLGSEVYIYVKAGTHSLIARVGAHDRPAANQDIDLVCDMTQTHFFDNETGQAII
jgi:multiple sugar transport system ATP-binding protein